MKMFIKCQAKEAVKKREGIGTYHQCQCHQLKLVDKNSVFEIVDDGRSSLDV